MCEDAGVVYCPTIWPASLMPNAWVLVVGQGIVEGGVGVDRHEARSVRDRSEAAWPRADDDEALADGALYVDAARIDRQADSFGH